jgi:hypothetical protein
MIPAAYFDRPDTPSKHSPVGKLMRKIHARFPHADLETIREESREALYGVGGENRVSIAFNRLLRSQKLDKAPRRARGKPDYAGARHGFRVIDFNCEPKERLRTMPRTS